MESFMKWQIYANEDNLEGTDRIYNKFLDVDVQNPRTHIQKGRALFTDYEILVKTNHPEFAIKDSCVRRRYSDFIWLENRLGINDIMMTVAPSLPGRRYFGRFKCQFLQKRLIGLQYFLNKVVEVTSFLYDPALHLFLQTDMSTSQMENFLRHGVHLSNVRDRIIAMHRSKENKQRAKDSAYKSFSESLSFINMKRTFSLDSFTASMSKVEENNDSHQDNDGRGWSRYIGERVLDITTDRDVTDFGIGYSEFRKLRRSLTEPTACVLPGGRLRLADDNDIISAKNCIKKSLQTKQRSFSWHGNTNDMVDLLLDSYDVIDSIPNDISMELDSTNIGSNISKESDSSGVWQEDSIDDGIQVDINQRLSEYTIVPMPQKKLESHKSIERLCHTSFPGFHHSLSCGSDSS